MRSKLLVFSLAFAIPACSGDGGSGPQGVPDANIGGTWDFVIANLSGTVDGLGISCSFRREINIIQTGSTFSGTADPGILSCQAEGLVASVPFTSEPIVNGRVNGSSIQWDFSTQDFHHAGTVSGNSLSGQATYVVDIGGTTGRVTFNGSFGASRLSGSAAVRPAGHTDALGKALRAAARP